MNLNAFSNLTMKINTSMTVGIIGGNGRTGGQFARLFKKQGFAVQTNGSKQAAKNKKILKECDVVIFAVPLRLSVEIIKKEIVHATKKDQLIMDLSSLKSEQVEAMKSAAGEVIGLHPLFGPWTDVKGQTIMLCPGRTKPETIELLEKIFKRMGMKTIIKDALAHDRLMAMLQVLPHVKNMLVADVLRKIDANISDILATCTPAYELELNVVGRFLDDNPDLYGPIILDNPDTLKILKTFRGVLDDCIEMAEGKDLHRFTQRYKRLQEFFGPFAKTGRISSEECIRTLSKLKKS